MPDIKIDKNVPMPGRKSRGRHYPLDGMNIGDSFFVPLEDEDAATLRIAVSNAAFNWGRQQNPPRKFSVRTFNDGVRCWRVK